MKLINTQYVSSVISNQAQSKKSLHSTDHLTSKTSVVDLKVHAAASKTPLTAQLLASSGGVSNKEIKQPKIQYGRLGTYSVPELSDFPSQDGNSGIHTRNYDPADQRFFRVETLSVVNVKN